MSETELRTELQTLREKVWRNDCEKLYFQLDNLAYEYAFSIGRYMHGAATRDECDAYRERFREELWKSILNPVVKVSGQ